MNKKLDSIQREMLMGKKKKTVQLSTSTITEVLFLETTIKCLYAAELFCEYFPSLP